MKAVDPPQATTGRQLSDNSKTNTRAKRRAYSLVACGRASSHPSESDSGPFGSESQVAGFDDPCRSRQLPSRPWLGGNESREHPARTRGAGFCRISAVASTSALGRILAPLPPTHRCRRSFAAFHTTILVESRACSFQSRRSPFGLRRGVFNTVQSPLTQGRSARRASSAAP